MSDAAVHGIDVDALVALVSSCRSVAALASGPADAVATFLPGRRVPGLRVGDDVVEVHVAHCDSRTGDRVGLRVREQLVFDRATGRRID